MINYDYHIDIIRYLCNKKSRLAFFFNFFYKKYIYFKHVNLIKFLCSNLKKKLVQNLRSSFLNEYNYSRRKAHQPVQKFFGELSSGVELGRQSFFHSKTCQEILGGN
jgi:hypothetical protein